MTTKVREESSREREETSTTLALTMTLMRSAFLPIGPTTLFELSTTKTSLVENVSMRSSECVLRKTCASKSAATRLNNSPSLDCSLLWRCESGSSMRRIWGLLR